MMIKFGQTDIKNFYINIFLIMGIGGFVKIAVKNTFYERRNMKAWMIKKGKKYLAISEHNSAFTTKIEKAMLYYAKRNATSDICDSDNEVVVPVEITVKELKGNT